MVFGLAHRELRTSSDSSVQKRAEGLRGKLRYDLLFYGAWNVLSKGRPTCSISQAQRVRDVYTVGEKIVKLITSNGRWGVFGDRVWGVVFRSPVVVVFFVFTPLG